MNSAGDITMCLAPLCHNVLGLGNTCPAALHCMRSLAKAGRLMYRQPRC